MPRLPGFTASPFVRFAMVMPLVIGFIVAAVFYPLYREAEKLIRDEVHAAIEQEILALDNHFHDLGMEALAAEINERIVSPIDPDGIYLLVDAGGHILAGNLPAWPEDVPVKDDKWFRVQDDDHRNIEGKVFILYGDQRLLVGRRSPLAAFRQGMIGRLMGSAALIVLAVALLATAFTQRIRRRLRNMALHARAIQEGHLSRRLPIGADNDELDELSANFNRAFNEIERLVEATRHISSALAHDMRRPVIALRNSLEAALQESDSERPGKEALAGLLEQTEDLLHTFGAVLRLARLESGGLAPSHALCQVHEIGDDVVELYAAMAEQQQRRLDAALTPCAIHGDRDLIFQLLQNLIENALIHGAGPIRLEIAPSELGDKAAVRIRVSDAGKGVPPDALERVFERFYQVDAARSDGTGSGLGLALVRGIAEAHGGTAKAENLAPGFAVEIRMPVGESTETLPAAAGADVRLDNPPRKT